MILVNIASTRLQSNFRSQLDGYRSLGSEENRKVPLHQSHKTKVENPYSKVRIYEKLEQFINAYPDATLEETKQHFSGVVECSIVAIHNTLKRLDLRYKKNRYVRASKTEKM